MNRSRNAPRSSPLIGSALSLLFIPMIASAGQDGRWGAPRQPGHALAVRVDDRPLVFLGQLLPSDEDGRIHGDARSQALRVLAHLRRALAEAGAEPSDVARINVYVTSDDVSAHVQEAVAQVFAEHPISITYVRSALPIAGALLSIDAVAAAPPGAAKIGHFKVPGVAAPTIGAHGSILPAGPKTFISGHVEAADDLRAAARSTLARLERSLEALELSKADVVQMKAFFKPFDRRADLEDEVKRFFRDGPIPPLVLVEWHAERPAEIELVVAGPARGGQCGERLCFKSLPGLPSTSRYSHAVIVERGTPLIFLGGLYGRPEVDVREQTADIFSRLGALLFEVGSSFRTLVKGTHYFVEPEGSLYFGEIRDVYYDPMRPPASSSLAVAGVGRPGGRVALDLIAAPRRLMP